MVSKRIFTRSHPNPNPHAIVDNPEKILRKTPRSENPTINKPLHKAISLPENLATLQDIQFNLHFEQSLFKTKSHSWIAQTVFDPSVLHQIPIGEASTSTQTEFQLLQHFESLQRLVTELTSTIDDSYLQQSV